MITRNDCQVVFNCSFNDGTVSRISVMKGQHRRFHHKLIIKGKYFNAKDFK